MRKNSGPRKTTAEWVVKDIRRKTRKQRSAEETIRIVPEGLRGEECIAALCRRKGVARGGSPETAVVRAVDCARVALDGPWTRR